MSTTQVKRLVIPALLVVMVALGGLIIGAAFRASPSVTTPFGPFTLVSAARGATAEAEAITVEEVEAVATALDKLAEMEPTIKQFSVADAALSNNLTRVDQGSATVFTSSEPIPSTWVLQFTAPASGEFSNVTAMAIVDATTGEIHAAAVTQNNE